MSGQSKIFNLSIRVNDKEVKTTLNSVGKELKAQRAYVRNLEEGTAKWNAENKKLAQLEKTYDGLKKRQREFIDQLKEGENSLESNRKAIEDFGEAFSQVSKGVMSGDLMMIQQGMMGVRASIAAATKAALTFIATPLGIALAALSAIAISTREWWKYNEAAREANIVTQQITRLSGDALDDARVRAKSIEKTFGQDFKETLTAASTLVEAFGISYEEAFDRIQEGLIRGGNQNGEFMDSIKEYPKLFAQAGFSAEDFQKILNTGIDLKIYSDKLPDAVKEFSLALMEETQTARDALENAFGKKFTNELFENIQNGSLTVKDALKLVSSEAETVGLNAQQAQQLTADLFKGAGEDAGGALIIFEAVNDALNDQQRQLTPLEEEVKRLAEANQELAEAQDNALKSDSYSAFANELEITWIKAKTDFYNFINAISEGLVTADTAFRKFVFQSVQYVKDSFTVGVDADWDVLGEEFDKKQKEREKAAAERKKKEDKKNNGGPTPEQIAARKALEKQEKEAEEAAKLRERLAKEAAQREKDRLEKIDQLKEEYKKKAEDRLADTAVKEAELEKKRALEKARALGAEKALLEEIEAEHKIRIDKAKAEQEAKDLERMRAFEDKRRELEKEIELENAETEAEKEEIRKAQELEKAELEWEKKLEEFQKEMAFLEMTEEEKAKVEQALKESHEATLAGIHQKWKDKEIEKEEEIAAAKRKLWNDSLNAAINLAGQETKIGQVLLAAKQILVAKEMVIEFNKFNQKMALKKAEATGDIATGFSKTAAAGFPQNIPLIIGFTAQVATIISTIKNAAKAGNSAKKGFYNGGDTGSRGLGFIDGSGHEPVGYVHKNEYVIPEIVRKDPEMPQIENYIENKRRKKLGLFYDGGPTSPNETNPISSGSDHAAFIAAIDRLLDRLDIPLEAFVRWDYETEQKRQDTQKKLDKIKSKSKIKKK